MARRDFGLFGLAILIVAPLLALLFSRLSQPSPEVAVALTLPDEIAAARRQGLPVDPLDPRPPAAPLPAGKTAAPLYERIRAAYDAVPSKETGRQSAALAAFLHAPNDPAQRKQARAILARWRSTMRLAEQAARLPRFDNRTYWERFRADAAPPYSVGMFVARLFAARATLESAAGRADAALASLVVASRMGRQLGEGAGLMGIFLRIIIRRDLQRAWLAVVRAHPDDARVRRQAATAIATLAPPLDLRRAVADEVLLAHNEANKIRNTPYDPEEFPLLGYNPTWAALAALEQRLLLREWTDGHEARALSYWRFVDEQLAAAHGDPAAAYPALQARDQQERARRNRRTYSDNPFVAPQFGNVALLIARDQVRWRLNRTLLALLEYRQRHGWFPAALSDLPGAPPRDVFVRQPLRYRRTKRGFVLYSVGENKKDEGGQARPARSDRRGAPRFAPDIVLTWPG